MNKDMKFEEAIAELERTVKALEDGNTPLDRALELYEQGIALIRLCNEKLEGAEQKINMLVNKGGDMVEEPFGDK